VSAAPAPSAQHRVTTKKYNGDDSHSWAVFVDGRVVEQLTGLNRQQSLYYKRQVLERYAARAQQLSANPG
jgi:hypothetical protein